MTELNTERPAESGDESTPVEPVHQSVEVPGMVAEEAPHGEAPPTTSLEAAAGTPEEGGAPFESTAATPATDGDRPQATPPLMPPPPVHAPAAAKRPGRTPRRLGIGVGAALVAGGLIGALIAVAAQPDPTTSKAYVSLKGVSSTQSAAIASDQASISDLQSQLSAFAAQSADMSSEAASLQARESAVAQREQAVQSAQAVIVQNQITPGSYVVGKDVKAGLYHTTGPDGSNFSGCYYEWKGSTDANAQIIDNNITQGPATATLTDGQVFTTNGCQAWQKIG